MKIPVNEVDASLNLSGQKVMILFDDLVSKAFTLFTRDFDVVATSKSAKALGRYAHDRGALEVNYNYDLKLSDEEA